MLIKVLGKFVRIVCAYKLKNTHHIGETNTFIVSLRILNIKYVNTVRVGINIHKYTPAACRLLLIENHYFCRTIAIYRQPPLSSVNNIFTLPFALNVWIAMVVIMIAFSVALMFLMWTSNRLRGENTPLSTTLDTVTLVLGAICQQGK